MLGSFCNFKGYFHENNHYTKIHQYIFFKKFQRYNKLLISVLFLFENF